MKLKTAVFALAIATAASVTSAADKAAESKAAVQLVNQALTCDIKDGRAAAVVKALKTLGATFDKGQTYTLATPIDVFGFPVKRLMLAASNGEGPDSYIAVFAGVKPEAIAAAAKLKHLGQKTYIGDGPKGTLELTAYTGPDDVRLACAPNS